MTFSEKLKSLRRRTELSQEQLAEKLGVSRQAVTKWETGAGIPDIENIMAVSALFGVTVDELLSCEKSSVPRAAYLFESVTEYDIDEPKSFDMHLGGANRLVLCGHDGEKLRVRIASDTLATIENDFKVKLDDGRKRIDVDLIRKNNVTEAMAKDALTVFIALPRRYVKKIEVAVNAQTVEVSDIECESVELDAKMRRLILDGVTGTVEVNCNLDMDITCNTLCGAVEINQISATSRIFVPDGTSFAAKVRGIGNSISYERDGKPAEPFCSPDADNIIELNGMKSELIVCTGQNDRA